MEQNNQKNLPAEQDRRPYIKPEAEKLLLCVQENIAASRYYDDEFNGEDHVFG